MKLTFDAGAKKDEKRKKTEKKQLEIKKKKKCRRQKIHNLFAFKEYDGISYVPS